jgi:hypothetical protein
MVPRAARTAVLFLASPSLGVSSGTISLFGAPSSLICYFFLPIVIAWIGGASINRCHLVNKLVCYFIIGGISTFGDENGWHSFLQDQLPPLGTLEAPPFDFTCIDITICDI